jgi:hypothetical protein
MRCWIPGLQKSLIAYVNLGNLKPDFIETNFRTLKSAAHIGALEVCNPNGKFFGF